MNRRAFASASAIAWTALASLTGCGAGARDRIPVSIQDDDSGAMTADSGAPPAAEGAMDPPDAAPYPAAHAALPRVMNLGGPVLASPTVIPVFFQGDALQAPLEQFFGQLAGSSYWTATTSEYGVGALQVGASVVVSDPAPSSASDMDIAAWLNAHLDGTDPAWPLPVAGSVYVVFYPQTTSITEGGGTSCQDFGGFHEDDMLPSGDAGAGGGAPFTFAVIARCPTFNGLKDIDQITSTVSHELIEASTDPFPNTSPAYAIVDFGDIAWNYMGGTPTGSEVGDMCIGTEANSLTYGRLVGDFLVQRTWSNQAASSGGDPCVPAVGGVYFNAAPDVGDRLLYVPPDDVSGRPFATVGVHLPMGESRTIPLRLFSNGPVQNWYLGQRELRPSGAPISVQLSFDRATGNNGDVAQLTLTRVAAGPLPGGFSEILLGSASDRTFAVGTYQSWRLLVGP